MFTKEMMEKIEAPFREQLKRMGTSGACGARAAQVERMVGEILSPGEAQALKCLYASMPMSDAADYPVELFEAYARHGAFLWEKGPFAGRVPEELFAAYVLHHRVNNEDLTEHREFFYGELKDRIAGMDMRQAVLEANYWCASQATYRATDERTASPMCVFYSAYGRCGEESTFTVSVLRSLGIPARQVYVPLWSHCDDNHAWVEAWCDGEWAFLGACEPEEVLNKGWFSGASSRAMLVHSRLLLPVAENDKDAAEKKDTEQVLDSDDMCHVLNQSGRYALTAEQEVAVRDRAGNPQPDALVRFEVMNGAFYGEIASVRTDRNGRCMLRTGLGSIHITASKDSAYGEKLVDAGKGECCEIVLDRTARQLDCWEEMLFSAPKDSALNRVVLTDGEKSRGRKRLEEMNRLRREKESSFYDEKLAAQATAGLDEEERNRCIAIMKKACGNQKEIADFLKKPAAGAYPERWKLAVLESLREKDYRDITAEVLEENCVETAAWEGMYEDALLVPYVLCPRVWNEMIRPFRRFIRGWLEQESAERGRNLAEEIRKDPALAWQLVKEKIKSDKKTEYGNLVTSAAGALESGYGSRMTQETVCVQILRTLGIPARLNPVEGMPEVWVQSDWNQQTGEKSAVSGGEDAVPESAGGFFPLERHVGTGRIQVCGQKDVEWNYFGNWTLARFDGDAYRPLRLGFRNKSRIIGPIPVFPGRYRALTANRLPNGNILAKQLFFELEEGQGKEIRLELAEAKLSDMLTDYDIADFALKNADGSGHLLSDLVREESGLFIWLGEGEEPTEHILNEIYERRETYAKIKTGMFFVAAHPRIRENPACRRVLEALPEIKLMYDDFGGDMEALARRLYLEPGKLPLAVLIDRNMRGIYSVAGYNVGTGDMILKLIHMTENQEKG